MSHSDLTSLNPAPSTLIFIKPSIPDVDGRSSAMVLSHEGMASIGQLKPLMSINGIDVLSIRSIAISLVLKIVDSEIPRKITARRNGIMKTISINRLDFIGRL